MNIYDYNIFTTGLLCVIFVLFFNFPTLFIHAHPNCLLQPSSPLLSTRRRRVGLTL